MREHRVFHIPENFRVKEALLAWSRSYNTVIWLDSNGHKDRYGSFDALLAVEQTDKSNKFINSIDDLDDFVVKREDWLFGYISYDFKNDLEDLGSQNFDGLQFPKIQFFSPSKLVILKDGKLHFSLFNHPG